MSDIPFDFTGYLIICLCVCLYLCLCVCFMGVGQQTGLKRFVNYVSSVIFQAKALAIDKEAQMCVKCFETTKKINK